MPGVKPYLLEKFKKQYLYLFFLCLISFSLHSQLAVAKMIGKNSKNSTLGGAVFAFWDIPVNDIGNRSVMIELMDLAYFPRKHSEIESVIGYLSIKAGYKYIFSEETKTGFYVEPSVGYCRVVSSADRDNGDPLYGDGIAIAAEGGYTVEVGQNGNNLNFGLKYESDIAGSRTTVSSIALRFSFAFHMFRKRSRD